MVTSYTNTGIRATVIAVCTSHRSKIEGCEAHYIIKNVDKASCDVEDDGRLMFLLFPCRRCRLWIVHRFCSPLTMIALDYALVPEKSMTDDRPIFRRVGPWEGTYNWANSLQILGIPIKE